MIRGFGARLRLFSGRRTLLSGLVLLPLACSRGTAPRRAVALAIATQPPATAQSGVELTRAPVVELRDQEDFRFTQPNVAITVSIATGGGTLTGTLTRPTDGEGRATFSDLVISGTVGPRTLSFTANGLRSATSTSFTLAAGP